MTQIASEDYPNKRIYLHPDTLVDGYNPIELYREHRQRRSANVNGERDFAPMVYASGNEQIGPSKYTPRRANYATGVRPVPHDTGVGTSYTLILNGQSVNIDDQLEDNYLFDRATVDAEVDIDIGYSPVEIREVSVVGGLTSAQDQIIRNMESVVNLLLDILQADEEVRDAMYRKLHKDTRVPLIVKNVNRDGNDIDLVEPD